MMKSLVTSLNYLIVFIFSLYLSLLFLIIVRIVIIFSYLIIQ